MAQDTKYYSPFVCASKCDLIDCVCLVPYCEPLSIVITKRIIWQMNKISTGHKNETDGTSTKRLLLFFSLTQNLAEWTTLSVPNNFLSPCSTHVQACSDQIWPSRKLCLAQEILNKLDKRSSPEHHYKIASRSKYYNNGLQQVKINEVVNVAQKHIVD